MKFIPEAKRLQKLAGIILKEEELPSLDAFLSGSVTGSNNTPTGSNDVTGSAAPTGSAAVTGSQDITTQFPPSGDITKEQAAQLIRDTKGKFFTVTFIKKDGTPRVMNARLGVKAYLRGGELPYDPKAKGLIPVFDVQAGDYRIVNTKTMTNLKIGNNIYKIR